MTSKENLLSKKELSAWWNGVTKHPHFQDIMLLARAHVVMCDNISEIKGAVDMLAWLETAAENQSTPRKALSSGLKHDFNPPAK